MTGLFEATLRQAERLAAMPESETKQGLIEASKRVLSDWLAQEEITTEERQRILDLLEDE